MRFINIVRPEIIYEDVGLIKCFKKYDFDIDNLVFKNNFLSKENGMVFYLSLIRKMLFLKLLKIN